MGVAFELFMGCLGNGVTICNKKVTEHGDYKKVGHISENGKIKYYVPEGYIPDDGMRRIKNVAERQRQKFLSRWNRLTDIQKYEKLLSSLTTTEFIDATKDKESTLADKVQHLEKKYLFTKEI